MSKYVWTDDMREISGFGGGYEATCRAMVVAGLEWFDGRDTAEPQFREYANITGIIDEENGPAKELTAAMLKAPGAADCTGAMMQFCVHHVMRARKDGWENYAALMRDLKRKDEEEEPPP